MIATFAVLPSTTLSCLQRWWLLVWEADKEEEEGNDPWLAEASKSFLTSGSMMLQLCLYFPLKTFSFYIGESPLKNIQI